MKKTLITFAAVATMALFACKDKAKEESSGDTTTPSAEQKPAEAESKPAANEPKTYKVTFAPDTVYLGKKKEAFIKVKNAQAVALQDPDGKSEGIEFTFDLEVTNKTAMGGNSVYFIASESRLTLDNNNNITQHSGSSVSVDPESTKDLTGIVYKIPAGAKPKALNLFYDGTRVSVGVALE
ncbi:hypothetical protein HB364_04260 [Pseudoflavitalea sp. X16]|uniref:hypothetical protein n=1 Tax=Paraflavitalea devenefica TaxID=2716334 RepID=UPI00141FB8B3|nr:hypothetical protein [Paraflavitalea devenefica]NII24277.1 hypothetical protein [Paraflavitalea devenefica]